jgi:predicted nucleic acid-binding Zn ribbon protein
VEDWEQHFAEKSRRRFEKERDERRRARTRLIVATALLILLFVGAVVGLAILS